MTDLGLADALAYFQALQSNEPETAGDESTKLQVLRGCQRLLEQDSSSSLTLLPGLLSLLSDPSSQLRILLIQLLQKIMRTAANFEPTTCIAGKDTWFLSGESQWTECLMDGLVQCLRRLWRAWHI
jgi:hypothetical protein